MEVCWYFGVLGCDLHAWNVRSITCWPHSVGYGLHSVVPGLCHACPVNSVIMHSWTIIWEILHCKLKVWFNVHNTHCHIQFKQQKPRLISDVLHRLRLYEGHIGLVCRPFSLKKKKTTRTELKMGIQDTLRYKSQHPHHVKVSQRGPLRSAPPVWRELQPGLMWHRNVYSVNICSARTTFCLNITNWEQTDCTWPLSYMSCQ